MEEMHPLCSDKNSEGNGENRDLFEDIRDDLQLLYISDIPRCRNPRMLARSVERMNALSYSPGQWKDLLLYILKTE